MNLKTTYWNLKKTKNGILFFVFFISTILAFSQPANMTEEDVIKQANEMFSKKDYQGALPLYAQLVSVHPAEPEYNYRFGVCTLFGDRHDKKKPIRYLNNASKSMKDNQKLIYYLGLAYHQNEEYATAMRYFNMYLAKLSPGSSERESILEKVNICLNGLNLSHKRLISEIISKSEFKKDNFYRAYRADEFDGSVVIKPEVFQTNKEKKRGELSFVYISEPRDVLYYAGYENDKSTNKEIFRVVMDADGNWGQPEKLDATINTPYNEDYPVSTDNGTTLYFCSKGHSSIGGYDIYRAKLDTVNNTFSQPENLGAGINSPFDDIMFVIDKDGRNAYFASDRDNLNGSINVFNIKLVDNPFNEEVLLAQEETNLEDIFAQKQISSNNAQQNQNQRNAKVAAYKAAHEHNVNIVQQTTTHTQSAASQKADNMMADRTRAHKMADSAYMVIAKTKKLIRDLTNKRDRANAISKRKANEAKALETRFDESISMIVKIKNESQFSSSLSKAIELKVEVCQLKKRAEIADKIAWNLGRQIKTKNKELEKLKLQAGKIQTASVSGTLNESFEIFTDFKELVLKADTIVDFTSQILAITNDQATYEVPKTELAFAENLMTAFRNNTLMAEAINAKPVIQEDIPIVIVDKRTHKPELINTAATAQKTIAIKPVELIPQISTEGILLANSEPVEDELDINFTIDLPVVKVLDLVEPVSVNEFAFVTEPDETGLELNFSVDKVKPLNLVNPVDMTYVAFNDIAIDDEQLDLSFDIDKRPVVIIPLADQVVTGNYAFNPDDVDDELEINFEIDKKAIRVPDLLQPIFAEELVYNTEPVENDLELNFELDRIKPVELIYPVDLSFIAFNEIVVDEKELEINFTADKSPIEVAPLIAPVYMMEYAFNTEPEELSLEINSYNDMITPADLINPVYISPVAFNDAVIDDRELEINFTIDKPAIQIAPVVEPIFYASNSNNIELFENELELNFANDIPEIRTSGVVDKVKNNTLAVNTGQNETEVNFQNNSITPVALINPVDIAAIANDEFIIAEDVLDINFTADEPAIKILPQAEPVYMSQLALNTEPEENDLDLNFIIDQVTPVKLAEPIDIGLIAYEEINFDEDILELNFEVDKLVIDVVPQVEPVYADAFALNTEEVEPELEINFNIDIPAFVIPEPVSMISYASSGGMPEDDEELEINFFVDNTIEVPGVVETVEYASNSGQENEVIEDIIQIDFDVDKQLNAFMEANRLNKQEALFYLRESVMPAKNIETSKSDLEILELALTTPEKLSYEELLYAASLAFRPEDKLIIYNAAFIHVDRDWRAYNNAAVSAIHIVSLGQADCYLFQASLISENNGSIENNRGILACYKDQYEQAEKYFVTASELGYDALYNLQVVNNLVNEFNVERIADRNKINQNKGTQKAVVDVIDYGTADD